MIIFLISNLYLVNYNIFSLKVVKFSPDGQLLALGSRDNYIYIYQVTDGAKHYTRLGRCTVSSSQSMGYFFILFFLTSSNTCIWICYLITLLPVKIHIIIFVELTRLFSVGKTNAAEDVVPALLLTNCR